MLLYLRELARGRKSLLVWTGVFVGYSILIFAIYPSFSGASEAYASIIKAVPKSIAAAFSLDSLDFSNLLAYFGTYEHYYFLIAGSIYAVGLGAGLLSREETEGTIEFLLAKPITRAQVVGSKALAAFTLVTAFVLVNVAVQAVLLAAYTRTPLDPGLTVWTLLSPLGAFWTFVGLGFLVSVLRTQAKGATGIGTALVLGTWMLGVVGKLSPNLSGLAYLSPLDWMSAPAVAKLGHVDPAYLVAVPLLAGVSLAATVVLYNRRDLRA